MSDLFDPNAVERFTDPRVVNGSSEVVGAADYDAALKLLEAARKYAEVEQTSRKYWSVRCAEFEQERDELYMAFQEFLYEKGYAVTDAGAESLIEDQIAKGKK